MKGWLPLTSALALWLSFGMALGTAACGSLATESYQGEPIFQLRGEMRASLQTAPSDLRLGLVFVSPQNDGRYRLHHVPAELESNFPARFTLTLREPPPETSIRTITGSEQSFMPAVLREDGVPIRESVADLVAAPRLGESIVDVPPTGDTLAVAEQLGWIAIAPLLLVYWEDISDATIEKARELGLGTVRNGFNVLQFDIERDFASLEYRRCKDVQLDAPQSAAAQCYEACSQSDRAEDDCNSCFIQSCGEIPGSPQPQFIDGDEPFVFDIDRDILALLRAQAAD